jgi:hypothetical protein
MYRTCNIHLNNTVQRQYEAQEPNDIYMKKEIREHVHAIHIHRAKSNTAEKHPYYRNAPFSLGTDALIHAPR